MTRVAKRSKPKTRHHRCTRCHSPVPAGYGVCGICGYDPAAVDDMMRKALDTFPGSRELRQ